MMVFYVREGKATKGSSDSYQVYKKKMGPAAPRLRLFDRPGYRCFSLASRKRPEI